MRQQVTYNIASDDGEESSVTAFVNGTPLVATKDHPNFRNIIDRLKAGERNPDTVRGLFDMGHAITSGFAKFDKRLSERITVAAGVLYLDSEPMHGGLADVIIRQVGSGIEDFQPLVNFLEKLKMNPNPHSVEHLWRWLANKSYSIDQTGDIIGYKGVARRGDHYESINSGRAIVNGVIENGRIPNIPDAIVEMPRSQVMFDPANGCSTGLHVGTWSFASGFGRGYTLMVKVHPRDVVSVPSDSGDQKMRVCRYKVVDLVDAPDTSGIVLTPTARTASTKDVKAQPEPKEQKRQRPAARKRVAQADAKKAAAKKAAPKPKPEPIKFPQYMEQYGEEHFTALPVTELRWIVRNWAEDEGIKAPAGASKMDRPTLVKLLVPWAKKRLATW